ncbi:MAG: immune inhibitor A [Anaerolineae bacterium]|nr:immune inhibitor A [Anaerolineae bacterium]
MKWWLVLFWISLIYAPSDPHPTLTAIQSTPIPPRDRVDLARRFYGIDLTPTPAIPPTYQVGDRKTFSAVNTDGRGVFQFDAELLAIGANILIWVDTRADIDPLNAQGLAAVFDQQIYPETLALWDAQLAPGIDGDPRIYALFAYGLGDTIGAYFSSDHQYPRQIVPHSNQHDLLFYNLSTLGTAINSPSIHSITAHEFQHLIRHAHTPMMDSWLDEGLSVFTEAHLGFDNPLIAAQQFLTHPPIQLNHWQGDTANYGASLLFTHYFYDQFGLDALRTVAQSPLPSLAAFDQETDVETLFADWMIANWRGDYADFPLLPFPFSPEIRTYPAHLHGSQPPYTPIYYQLQADAGDPLSLTLDLPTTIPLLPIEIEGHFWYSNRADDSNPRLTRTLDLTTIESPRLSYAAWVALEDRWDYGYVSVSADHGASWRVLTTPQMTDANPNGTAYAIGYTGRTDAWIVETLDLSAYRGQMIEVRFEVVTDDSTTDHGMALDQIALNGVTLPAGGWESEGWLWIKNELPLTAMLQVIDGERVDRRAPRSGQPERFVLEQADPVIAIAWFAPLTTLPIDYRLGLE